ncbi:MAG: TIGR02147 family protein [Pseudobdellovibrio sp.]
MYSTTCNIYHYESFRTYLSDVVYDLKKRCVGFTYRSFSKSAGFGSPNFLLLLIKGDRNLSVQAAAKIAKTFGLDRTQSKFFENLVMYNQSKVSEEKIIYATQIIKIRSQLDSYTLKQNQFCYYTNWRHVAIKELLQINPRLSNLEIAELLNPQCTLADVENSVEILISLGFIKKENDIYQSLIQNIITGDKFISTAVVQFHKNMIRLGSESLDRFTANERDVTAATVALSKENFEKIRLKINDLRQEIMALAETEQNDRSVIQINFQMFPLTKKVQTK